MGKHIKSKEWANIIEEAHNQKMYARILKRGTGTPQEASAPPRGKEIFVNGRMEKIGTMPFGDMSPERKKLLKQILDTTKSF